MYTIGVDLGGTNIAIGLCDAQLKIVDKGSVPTVVTEGPERIVKDMTDLVKVILERNKLTIDDIASVGIASPGSCNTETGVVEYANNIPFVNFPIADVFKSYLPVKKVIVANDANAAALGEALAGSAKGAKTAIMITLGTGVGSGIIIDGKIFAGGINYCGAELGHAVLVANGRPCSCGRRGCWEAYSSATALTKSTEEKMNELRIKGIPSLLFDEAKKEGKVSARTAFNAMRGGDKYGKELVDEYVMYLGIGLGNLVNVFQPEVICLGGGVSNEKENLVAPVRAIADEEQYTRHNAVRSKIICATLGNDAGIIGAAGLK